MEKIIINRATNDRGEFFQISFRAEGIALPPEFNRFLSVNTDGEEWICDVPIADIG